MRRYRQLLNNKMRGKPDRADELAVRSVMGGLK